MLNGYRPEIDVSPELEGAEASYFHSLIGVLHWIVELGRADIYVEVLIMSLHLALPRQGHMKELYRMFTYIKKHYNVEKDFDPTPLNSDWGQFERQDWSYFSHGHEDMREELLKGYAQATRAGLHHASIC